MNIDELKNAWSHYDESLESKINLQLLKTVSISKTHSLTRSFRFNAIVETVVSAFFVNYMAQVVIEHIATWEYWVPALVIGLCSLGTVLWNVHNLIQISLLKYDANIAEMQKKLERIHLQSDWQHNALQYLVFPLVAAMLAIMGLKYLNLDLSGHLNIILYAIISGVVVVPFVIWLNKKFPDKEMQSAIDFLKEIKKFEKE